MEQLVFVDPSPSSDLDDLVKDIDRRVDASFLADLEEALDRARDASLQPERASA
jgi:hypothetical protein